MNKKISIGIIAIIILALLAGFFILTPHYKEIEMSGYTFEVPDSNVEVKNNSINYNTYTDTENDLNIKTWSCKDTNDINGTINASKEIELQLKKNNGTNTTYNNISLYNNSGIYTYYESDVNNSCIILITSKNLNSIEHILETINKPKLNVKNPFNITSNGLIINNSNDNTTSNNQISTKKTTPTKKTSSKSNTGSSSEYKWSAQYGDYIKEYTDSKGVQHIDSKKGYKSSYNPKTGVLKEENYEALL